MVIDAAQAASAEAEHSAKSTAETETLEMAKQAAAAVELDAKPKFHAALAQAATTAGEIAATATRSVGEIEFQRIVEALTNMDDLMLIRAFNYEKGHEWIRNAVDEHNLRPFHAIVSTKNHNKTPSVILGQDIDPTDPPALWSVPTSRRIKRRANEMAECVHTLLTQAREVLFIDPYYGPARLTHRVPLTKFLASIADRDGRLMPNRIEYHTSNFDNNIPALKAGLEQWVKPSLAASVTLTVVRWNEKEMHNRYIVTDRGGVMFGNGLGQDDSHPTGFDTVTLLDEITCKDLFADYSQQSTNLTWLNDTHPITG